MRDVLAYVQAEDRGISEGSARLLVIAQGLAGSLGGKVEALLSEPSIDPDDTRLQLADTVITFTDYPTEGMTPDVHESLLELAVRSRKPAVVLIENNTLGLDLAPGVAASTGRPLVSQCIRAAIEEQAIVLHSVAYGGQMVAVVRSPLPVVLAVNSDCQVVAEPLETKVRSRVSIESSDCLSSPRMWLVGAAQEDADSDGVDITASRRIVCIGRGIGSGENVAAMAELAKALDSDLCATRPLIDLGWLPKTRQVGKSGRIVRPKVYVALGVSGAPEHIEGMREAELIVAINIDPSAPIFGIAHYGATCDLFEFAAAIRHHLALSGRSGVDSREM